MLQVHHSVKLLFSRAKGSDIESIYFQKHLLEIIKKRRKEKKYDFPQKVEKLDNFDELMINNHLLLFTSALVPKGLSSILTSFALEIGKSDRVRYM